MLMSSPTQELKDYEVVYRPYGETVVCRLGNLAEYYGYDEPESTTAVDDFLGIEYQRYCNWHDNSSRFMEWWQRFMASQSHLLCDVMFQN